MRYADIKKNDINNGEGLVVSLWVTGCPIKCPNCHNESIWDRNTGKEFTSDTMLDIIEALEDPRVDKGFSILGGEPLADWNYETVLDIVKSVRGLFPHKKIWLWTGYNYDNVKNLEIFKYLDVVIDGMYIDSLKDNDTWWRGSSNQRKICLNG